MGLTRPGVLMQPQSSDPQKRRKSLANHEIVTMALTLCGVVACIFWITLLCPLAQGQRAADSPATAPRPLITQPVDESQRTTLSGNTYPLARPEFDVGTAPASLPMERMLLVLKRSPETARRSAGQGLAQLPPVAHARGSRHTVWPDRRRYADDHGVAPVARI